MMLDALPEPKPDAILSLMQAFKDDPRDAKVDLGVGVFKDASGNTPIMRAVKTAERRLVESQDTKVYTGLAGDPAFADAMTRLLLGDGAARDRLAAVATPGGTGAVRQGLDLVRMAAPEARVWVSAPTWPNHTAIIAQVGLERRDYRYFDDDTRGVDFGAMMDDLGGVRAGDAVLLHGCCHNPTGADLTGPQWREVAGLIAEKGATAFVDIAYQGFGEGLEADAAGLRTVLDTVPEAIVAASCSKNFGIYRERTGLLLAMAPSTGAAGPLGGAMATLNRLAYSFPPDHGARVVQTILDDDALAADWRSELEETRLYMQGLRRQLADALRERTGSDRFGFLAAHNGMFSRLGASPEQVEAMRRDHGVYMVGDSRMNVAGLNAGTVPILADAIVATGV